MTNRIDYLWQHLGLWLFKDIMPPEDPFLRLKVTLQEVMPRYVEALECATVAFRRYAEVVAGHAIEETKEVMTSDTRKLAS